MPQTADGWPEWLSDLAWRVNELLRAPENMTHFRLSVRDWDSWTKHAGNGRVALTRMGLPEGYVIPLCERHAALGIIHDAICVGETPIDPWADERKTWADHDRKKGERIPGQPGQFYDSCRFSVRQNHGAAADRRLLLSYLKDVEEDLAEANRPLTDPTQRDVEDVLWAVLIEQCDPARWALDGKAGTAALVDKFRKTEPRVLSVPGPTLPPLVADALRERGFRVPWSETHGPGGLDKQGGGRTLLDILLRWEREGRVERVTGGDAEYELLTRKVVKGEIAWRPTQPREVAPPVCGDEPRSATGAAALVESGTSAAPADSGSAHGTEKDHLSKCKRPRRRSYKPYTGHDAISRAMRDRVLEYDREHAGQSYREIETALKTDGLDISDSTIRRILKNAGRRTGNPPRAAAGGNEREAVAPPDDLSDQDAWTMPD